MKQQGKGVLRSSPWIAAAALAAAATVAVAGQRRPSLQRLQASLQKTPRAR